MTMRTYINGYSLKAPQGNLKRREFLWLGSAFSLGLFSAVAFKANHFSQASNLLTETESQSSFTNNFLSLGFWDAEEMRNSASPEKMLFKNIPNDDLFTPNIVAADSLEKGDIGFLQRGAKIEIQPVYPHQWESTGLRSLSANIYYQPAELSQEVKVCTWCLTNTPVLNVSAPTSFVIPVERSQGLKLSFDLESNLDHRLEKLQSPQKEKSTNIQTQEKLLHLYVGGEPGTPQLRRGVYIVAGKSNSTGKLPVWNQYQLKSDASHTDQQPYLFRLDQHQNQLMLADFPYLLISVNYGSFNLSTPT